jgi:hypothetical protein
MECSYCHKHFSNSYTLKTHQNRAKSCINIQEQNGITVKRKIFTCTHCNKTLVSKVGLVNHEKICKARLTSERDQTIKKTRVIIDETEDKIEQLASDLRNHKEEIEYELKLTKEELKRKDEETKEELKRKDDQIKALTEKLNQQPKKITNKTTNHTTNIENQTNHITIYEVMTPERVLEIFQKHYNLDTLLGGQKSLARFVNDGFLKEQSSPVYLCGDRSRQKFYMLHDGKRVEDTDCEHIIGLTAPGLPRVQKVYEEALFTDLEQEEEDTIQDQYRHIMSLNEDRADFKSELSKIISSSEQDKPMDKWNRIAKEMEKRKKDMFPSEKKDKEVVVEELIRRPDVLGYSRGKLMVYRDRYRKDGTVKAPRSIMEIIETDEAAKKEYMEYLQSYE